MCFLEWTFMPMHGGSLRLASVWDTRVSTRFCLLYFLFYFIPLFFFQKAKGYMKYFNFVRPDDVYIHQSRRARTDSFHDLCKLGLCHKLLDRSLYGAEWVTSVTPLLDVDNPFPNRMKRTLFSERIQDCLDIFSFFSPNCTFFKTYLKIVASMRHPARVWAEYPVKDFTKEQWAHFKNKGKDRAMLTSQQLNNKLHVVLEVCNIFLVGFFKKSER